MSLCAFFPQFYIRDTKSSNGTFVNETRLSPSGEESAPRELRSKDIVQFGVNVNVDKKGWRWLIDIPHCWLLCLMTVKLWLRCISPDQLGCDFVNAY